MKTIDPRFEIPLKDLEGEWIGHYRGHTEQTVRFTIENGWLTATKITGDEHVPGGEITFKANLNNHGIGVGQVAEKEFRNSTWVPGKLVVIDKEHVQFTWAECGTVSYRKDD